jgi:predicted extracellular nuclease
LNPIRSILLTTALSGLASGAAQAAALPPADTDASHAAAQHGKLPIAFEANLGQADAQVRYLSRGPGYSLFLTPAEAVLSLRTPGSSDDAGNLGSLRHGADTEVSKSAVLRLSFDGANRNPSMGAEQQQSGHSNYFVGSDASAWRRDVPNYARVRYTDLYPGVDLLYYGNQLQLEYDLVVAPGADPARIALRVDGADRMRLDGQGNLVLATAAGNLVQHRPIAYQQVGGQRHPVAASYQMLGNGRIGFRLGDYDASRELVIDPVLMYSTYLGGTLGDRALDVVVDGSKNAYVVGFSNSAAFPTKGAYQAKNNGAGDVFVTKLSPSGALLFSTYIGGAGADEANGVDIDANGNVYVTGRTTSLNYPTVSAYQSTLGGVQDAFLTKLSPAGNSLVFSTYLGGNANTTYSGATGDFGYGVQVDANGSAVVAGWTAATNFPTVNPIQANRSPAPAGCDPGVDVNKCARSEAFVAKFSANGTSLIYSTYLGGTEYDEAYSLAVDASGNAYITGTTSSSNFPLASPKQAAGGANGDAFVTKVNPSGSALVYSTYLGGVGQDLGYGITVDGSGAAYVVGVTASANFPLVNPAQSFNGSGGGSATDGFVTKVAAAGNAWAFSTYIGGSGADSANGVAVDDSGSAYVAGQTASATLFPLSNAIQSTLGGGTDAFLAKLSASGNAYAYSTYLGGSVDDFGNDVAVDASGDAYIAGHTASTNFPVLAAAQATNAGSQDAFVARISTSNDATVSINDVRLNEGNSGTSAITFTVSLSKPLAGNVTFTAATAPGTATAGNDYVTSTQAGLVIAAGTTSKTVTFSLNGDTTPEPDETFFVNLSAVTGALIGDGQGVGTIANDDAASLSINDATVTEGNAGTTTATFTVTLSAPSANATTFNIATADGTAVAGSDYVASSLANQSIPAGSTSKTFSVTVNGDTATEPNETFFVNLSNATNAVIADGQGVGTINNDDTAPLPALSVSDASVSEGNSGTVAAVFTVSLSAVAQQDVSFSVFTSGNTAGSPADFTAINLGSQVIPAGSSNKTFSVLVNGDTLVEPNETFFFNVSSVSGATVADAQGTGTILNDDAAVLPAISVNDVRVTEGNAGTVVATFTVQLSAVPSSTVTFDVGTANGSAAAGSDYAALALAGQSIAAGNTSKTFNVTINGDTTVENDETFFFNVSNASANVTVADGQGLGTIANDDSVGTAPPQVSVSDVSVDEGNNGNQNATFTISLSAATANPVNFDVFTSNGTAFGGGNDYDDVIASLSIPAGQTSTSVIVPINPDTAVEANETFTLNLNNVANATVLKGQGRGTIVNDDNAKVSIGNASLVEGNGGYSTVSFVVTLSQPMPTPVTFDFATNSQSSTATAGTDYEAANKTGLLIDAGRTRTVVEVKVFGDTAVEADETFKGVISNVSGASINNGTGTATITNDDASALTIAQVQGIGATSPMVGESVSTEGVVTATTDDGFFLQSSAADQDGDARSSEGLFVRMANAGVSVGDRLQVAGRVDEAFVGAGREQLTQTELVAAKVDTLARGVALPAAVEITAETFVSDPSLTAYERFEGMRTRIAELTVVAPSGGSVDEATGRVRGNGKFYGVAAGLARPYLEAGLNVLSSARAAGVSPQLFDANPERLRIEALGQEGASLLSADAGDSVRGLVGVLAYGEGAYRLLPDPSAEVRVSAKANPQAVAPAATGEASIGLFPLRRFFDDRRDGNEPVLASAAYATRLAKTANAICRYTRNPSILALSGVENAAVMGDVAAAANAKDGNLLFAGSCSANTAYAAKAPSAAARSGFLVDTTAVRPGVARVEVLSVAELGAAARFANRDGSRQALHAQAPVLMKARLNDASGASRAVAVLNAHLSALDGDLEARGTHGWATRGEQLRAQRAAQARAIAQLVRQRQLAFPGEALVVLGDFEAAEFNDGRSDLMGVLSGRTAPRAQVLGFESSPLVERMDNLTTRLPAAQRYTVVRDGNAQAVDHILASAALLNSSPAARVEVARINADFGEDNYADAAVPVRVSDHDPMVLTFDLR